MKIIVKTPINKNYREVFSHFDRNLFLALRPPMVKLTVERFDGCKKGDEIHLKISGMRWISHITELFEGSDEIYFIDIGAIIPPPLKSWKHIHHIERINENKCMIIDEIDYSTGNKFTDKLIYPALLAMFMMRKPIYQRELA